MTTVQESDQVQQRRTNLQELRNLGVDVYPRRFDAAATIDAVVAEHGSKEGAELEAAGGRAGGPQHTGARRLRHASVAKRKHPERGDVGGSEVVAA